MKKDKTFKFRVDKATLSVLKSKAKYFKLSKAELIRRQINNQPLENDYSNLPF